MYFPETDRLLNLKKLTSLYLGTIFTFLGIALDHLVFGLETGPSEKHLRLVDLDLEGRKHLITL